MSYDLIGDVHGCIDTLEALLRELGYRPRNGAWRHGDRQAIFVGDLVDRGPGQRAVIDLVRAMVAEGSARIVMGNHEFHAIAYATPDPRGGWLRRRSEKNARLHAAFLDDYGLDSAVHRDAVAWMAELPLWLDLGHLRVVHACWDDGVIAKARVQLGASGVLNPRFLEQACMGGSDAFGVIQVLLKGRELRLPEGVSFVDNAGTRRTRIRTRWWDPEARSYRARYLGSDSGRAQLPDTPSDGASVTGYPDTEPPCFIGHYWLEGDPELQAPNVACLDYSVTLPVGKLVAYRWNGEPTLRNESFVAVPRLDECKG